MLYDASRMRLQLILFLTLCMPNIVCADDSNKRTSVNNALQIESKQGDTLLAEGYYQQAERYRTGADCQQNFDKAYRLYKQAADLNYTSAIHALAMCHLQGIGIPCNPPEFLRLIEISARKGYRKSISCLLAVHYGDTPYFPKNKEKYEEWFKYGANLQIPEFMYEYGGYLLNTQVNEPIRNEDIINEGLSWITLAANQGLPQAQNELGRLALYGIWRDVDGEEAIKWLTLAAEQGLAVSQRHMGICYTLGIGVEQNFETAFMWFTKAANGGDADAQMYLALAYYNGEGTEQNLTESYKWAQKAEAQGHEDAEALLKKINCNIASPDTESLNK